MYGGCVRGGSLHGESGFVHTLFEVLTTSRGQCAADSATTNASFECSIRVEGERRTSVESECSVASREAAAKANGTAIVDESLDRAVVLFASLGGLKLLAYAGARKTSNGYSQ